MGKLVAYYRVSTDKQGQSGLGLDAQATAVEAVRMSNDVQLVASFTEVETGKRSDRTELLKAIAHARRLKATLVVAKLDRLARNTRFLLTLVESGCDVIFGDLPSIPKGAVGKFMLTQLAAVAELEAGLISERTKAALAAARARGVVLGKPENLTHDAQVKGAQVNLAQALQAYAVVVPILQRLRGEGCTLAACAERLNLEGHTTRTGAAWTPVQVKRVLDRS